jgi:peptide/nickel transport system permease protein
VWIGILVVLAVILVADPGLIARGDPYFINISDRLQPPSLAHLFGTDEDGRDIFLRVVYGARISIGASVAVVAIAAAFGTVYGSVAAWKGGLLGQAMMKGVDLFLAFPYLVLAMAIAASLGRGIQASLIALTVVWWPGFARMVHGRVLSILKDLQIQSARALGASTSQILRWHVMPHVFDQIQVRFALDIGYVLAAFTGLSFLGLGAQPPSPEWGLMVSDAEGTVLIAWWYAVLPGLVIFATILNFVLLSDHLRRRATP